MNDNRINHKQLFFVTMYKAARVYRINKGASLSSDLSRQTTILPTCQHCGYEFESLTC